MHPAPTVSKWSGKRSRLNLRPLLVVVVSTATVSPSVIEMDVQDRQHMDKSEALQIQTLNTKQGKPTKYKILEPTLAGDLLLYKPERYTKVPNMHELDLVSEDDLVKISFINRQDIWLYVERVEEDSDIIYGKVAQPVKEVSELQKGQRVAVMRQHVCEVKYHDPHDDSD